MAEDLTTYTEVDFGGHISKTSSRVTASNLDLDEDAYLYKDFGTSYFDGITLTFAGRCLSTSVNYSYSGIGFSNSINDIGGWSTPFILIGTNVSEFSYTVSLGTGGTNDTSVALTFDATYYFSLVRSAGSGTVVLYIYSDAARTSLVDTLMRTFTSSTKFQYMYPITSLNLGTGGFDYDGYYENLELSETVAFSGSGQIIGLEIW